MHHKGAAMVLKRTHKKTTNELFLAIKKALERKSYIFTSHAFERLIDRNINELTVIRILKSQFKYHEVRKDSYAQSFRSWNYSIVGISPDDEDIRIIVSFEEETMLVITVINLGA